MKSIWAVTIGLVLISAEGTATAGAPAGQALGPYVVSAIRPRFFLHETGVLETEEESRAGGFNKLLEAEAMLVFVELSGPRFPVGRGGAVDFTATSGKTRLLHRWQSLEQVYVSDSGHLTLPFLVYGVACEPIKISATLFANGKRSTKTEVIPLACGE